MNSVDERARTIADLKPGCRGRVTRISGRGALRQRLLDMGVLPTTVVEVARLAPAGDPIWIRFDGCQISLRRREARTVTVTRC